MKTTTLLHSQDIRGLNREFGWRNQSAYATFFLRSLTNARGFRFHK